MNEEWVPQTKGQIEQRMHQILPPEDEQPASLHSAMRYSVLAGGKRLRGMLLVAAGQIQESDQHHLLTGAAAVEFFHAYTLIHDDLPAMDDDNLRRGKPTNHKVYGEAVAILAGDALQALAFQTLAELAPLVGIRAAAAVTELAAAGGSQGVVGGQTADILHQDGSGTITELEYIHNHKTGDLIAASLRIGGLLGGVSPEILRQLTGFARSIGLAFQIVDDLLDITGTDVQLGKDAGSDSWQGKLTYPSLLGVGESRQRVKQLYQQAICHLDNIDGDTSALRFLANTIIKRNN